MKDATNVILFYFFHDKFPVVGEARGTAFRPDLRPHS
jgi:hypothetical protein